MIFLRFPNEQSYLDAIAPYLDGATVGDVVLDYDVNLLDGLTLGMFTRGQSTGNTGTYQRRVLHYPFALPDATLQELTK